MKERIESYRALGLISYRVAKQRFHKAERSGSEGDYQAAIEEFETSLKYFTLAVSKEYKVPKDLIGTARKEGKNEIETELLASLDNYLSEVFNYERLDTLMNWGFAEYFMGRALKERLNPDAVKGNSHLDVAVQLFTNVLNTAKENSEMFRFRGSAKIAKGEYNSGVDDILTAVRLGTNLKDNALSKIVLAATELIEMTDDSSYTDYDSTAKRIFGTLKNETDVCGNRLKDEIFDLGRKLSGHKKRCNVDFFDDLYACIEKYGHKGKEIIRSTVKGCGK